MAMKECKDCGARISTSASKCPQCGKKQGGNKLALRIVLGIFIIIIGIIAIASGTGNTNTTSGKPSEQFTLQEGYNGYSDGYGYYIEGTITNNTDKQYSYAQVTFNLYDKDENQLGTAVANINNLDANANWKFKAIGLITDAKAVSSYKLTEITGF